MTMPDIQTLSPLPVGLETLPDQVGEIVCTILGVSPDKVSGNATLLADLGATSLEFVELVMAVEDVFGVEISDADANKVVRVDDLVALVDRKRTL